MEWGGAEIGWGDGFSMQVSHFLSGSSNSDDIYRMIIPTPTVQLSVDYVVSVHLCMYYTSALVP